MSRYSIFFWCFAKGKKKYKIYVLQDFSELSCFNLFLIEYFIYFRIIQVEKCKAKAKKSNKNVDGIFILDKYKTRNFIG